MIGYKVLSKEGLKGPFKKSSILKAITSAMLPLQARLLDLQTGRYILAAELVGEHIDSPRAAGTEPRPKAPIKADKQAAREVLKQMAEKPLTLDEQTPVPVEETPRVILRGNIPLRQVRLPKPRKLTERAPEDLTQPAA